MLSAFAIAALAGIAGPAVGALLEGVKPSGGDIRSADALPTSNQMSGGKDAKFIPSNEPGALKTPDQWACDYLLPDYQSWLEDGKSPEDWPMVDQTYVDVDSGKHYNWGDWIDWVNDNECVPVGLVKPESLPVASSIFGPLLGIGGAAGAAATIASTTPDSPG